MESGGNHLAGLASHLFGGSRFLRSIRERTRTTLEWMAAETQ